jgi:7-cyano-7-deazaguanine synthase in queuosine biosynthesis
MMRAIVFEGHRPDGLDPAQVLPLQVGGNMLTGEKEFTEKFGEPTSLERDLLAVGAAIFNCDLSFPRGEREEINRSIEVEVPVVNLQAFLRQKARLERILHILSNDNWTLTFTHKDGAAEAKMVWPTATGKTLLFSGGLDSLAGAIDLLDKFGPEQLLLASHASGNKTVGHQNALHDYLEVHYKAQIERVRLRIGRGKEDDGEAQGVAEVTQRTRSFVFLAIASLAARRRGMNEVVNIAENGQMAIHLPLSAARIGAFSTHTAHPEFITNMEAFLQELLNHVIRIENPYLYNTKAEVVRTIAVSHPDAIPKSNSCWRSARVPGHCGQCIPCFIRRIALEFHGVTESTWVSDTFAEDLAQLPPDHEGKRNLAELATFIWDFRFKDEAELDFDYIDLNNDHFDRVQAREMYRRFAEEATSVLQRYPNLAGLLA